MSKNDHKKLKKGLADVGGKEEPSNGVPDGGWGWMVVLGCCAMHMILGGIGRSYGLIYIQLRNKFGSSAAITAWVGGLHIATRMAGSPVASALCSRFSARSVVVTGGLIYGLSFASSAFTTSTELMFLSYSIISGFAGSLVYAPCIIMVGKYFDKHRGIATGLGTAGSGLGVFILPPLISFLFHYYGFTGTMLILGAISLNLAVCGALMRPLDLNKMRNVCLTVESCDEKKAVTTGLYCSSGGDVQHRDPENNTREEKMVSRYGDNAHDSAADTILVTEASRKKYSRSSTLPCFQKRLHLDRYLDYKLFCDPIFLGFGLALCFITMSYMAAQMLLPDLALSRGISNDMSVLLLSVLGLTDCIGRILSGIIFDQNFIKKHRLKCYNLAIFISASTNFVWSICPNFTCFLVTTVVHGLFNGSVVSQRAVIASDLLGINRLNSSFGLTVFLQGMGLMIGPTLAGFLRDITGGYMVSYVFCGGVGLVAASIFLLEIRQIKRKEDVYSNKNDV